MPFIYVYSPSDFVGGLPDESGSAAAGNPTFTLTLVPGATPTAIEIFDDDLIFDEVDGSQILNGTVDIDGTTYTAGTSINTAYDLINTTTGHRVTSFHFGGDGFQQGPVDGIVSTVLLSEGTNYTFNSERTSHQQPNAYTDYVACFTRGVQIQTINGQVKIEDLVIGDSIATMDNGFQTLRAVLKKKLSTLDLETHPNLMPVRILAGTLGKNLPKKDLLVSPQHCFLAVSPIATRMFGCKETLVSAKKLTVLPGIFFDDAPKEVEYFHLVLDNHEIIFAENTPTESFYFGPLALKSLSLEAREEIHALFPEVFRDGFLPVAVRKIPSGKRQAKFIQRHFKNEKPILDLSARF